MRITPAYAGQMKSSYAYDINAWDHPRIRGTNQFLPRLGKSIGVPFWDHPRIRGTNKKKPKRKSPALGSPPHTRDKWKNNSRINARNGITPAYAGQILKDPIKIKSLTADYDKIHSLLLPVHKSI